MNIKFKVKGKRAEIAGKASALNLSIEPFTGCAHYCFVENGGVSFGEEGCPKWSDSNCRETSLEEFLEMQTTRI
ncbi:hypothetical protein ACFL22_00795 [Patescibacteria group bacterium]